MNAYNAEYICVIWHGCYPWDVRLEKFINTLSESYGVCLISKGKNGMPSFEKNRKFEINRVSGKKCFNAPIPFSPIWLVKSLSIVRKKKISLIIVRDLPLIWLGVIIGRLRRIPVIFDMAENYPAALMVYNKRIYKPFLFGNGFLAHMYEKIAVKMSDHIFTVTEEQKDRLIHLGISNVKISLVLNTPVLEGLPVPAKPLLDKSIIYIGKIDAHRGLDTAILSMPKIVKKFPTAKLLIVGDGTETVKLKKMADGLGVKDNVLFLGWIPHNEVYDRIRQSSVCLIPHLKSEHTDTTLPNKLFDYMALGKPIISSNLIPIARILNEYKCGFVFESGNPDSLYEQIERIFKNLDSAEFGENGRKAVLERFNWKVDSANLQKVVCDMLNTKENYD